MAEAEPPPQDIPQPPFRRYRWIVSAFVVFHVASVLIYLGPTSEERVSGFSDWMSRPLLQLSRTAWRVTSPVINPYFRLFNLQQDWRLFGPRPSRWTTAVDVIAFYPENPDDPLSVSLWEAAGSDEAAGSIPWPDSVQVDPGRWVQDTVRLRFGAGGEFPNFIHQREHRLAYNLGLDDFFASYGAIFSRWQCLTLRGPDGRPPDGIQVLVDWIEIPVPWREPEPPYPPNFMGGFTCPALLAVEVE